MTRWQSDDDSDKEEKPMPFMCPDHRSVDDQALLRFRPRLRHARSRCPPDPPHSSLCPQAISRARPKRRPPGVTRDVLGEDVTLAGGAERDIPAGLPAPRHVLLLR